MTVNVNTQFLSYDPNQAKQSLRSLLDECSHYGDCVFKIGMSFDPVARVVGVSTRRGIPSKHGRLSRTYRWQVQSLTLFILLQTHDYGRCQDTERDMIRILRDHVPDEQIMNAVGGGGGRRPSRSPFHVYLVRSG